MPAGAEVVYSTAVPPENPERAVAAGRELHRADLLAQIAALRRCIAVTGTHGKTTTTAMIVHVLRGCGLDPAYVVGGELRLTGTNAGWGTGEWIVIEADESDRSLLKLDPEIAVLTNAELDHHSTYASLLDLEETFRDVHGPRRRRAGGRLGPARLCAPCARRRDPLRRARPGARPRPARAFSWRGLDVALSVPGAHNAINAAGALDGLRAGRRRSRAARPRRSPTSAAPAAGSSGSGRQPSGGAGLRRLRPPSHRGRGCHRRRAHARAGSAGRGLPTPPVLAYAALGARVRPRAGRGRHRRRAGVYPAREQAEDFPGIDGRLVAAAAADAADGRQVAWLPGFDDRAAVPARTLRAGDLCL